METRRSITRAREAILFYHKMSVPVEDIIEQVAQDRLPEARKKFKAKSPGMSKLVFDIGEDVLISIKNYIDEQGIQVDEADFANHGAALGALTSIYVVSQIDYTESIYRNFYDWMAEVSQ